MKVSNSPSQSNTKENYDKNYEFVCGGRTLILKKMENIIYVIQAVFGYRKIFSEK